MAITQNPIVGRARGKVSNNVFTTWKGLNVWKAKPITVSNPQTDGQLKQRSKFSILVAIASQLLAIVRIGFKEQAIGKTEVNAFNSTNQLNKYLNWTGNDWTPDPSKLQISKGSLGDTVVTPTTPINGSSSITITYPNTATGAQSLGDKIMVYVESDETSKILIGNKTRQDGSIVVNMDVPFTSGDIVNVYTFFQSVDGRKVSNNTYNSYTVL
mgnify:CR=1 FL=1